MTHPDDGTDRPAAATADAWRQVLVRVAVRLLLASFAAAFLAMVVVLVVVWAWWQGDPNDAQRSRGVNALWAAHTWVGDRHTDAEYEDFARLLTTNEISDVFFHAGPLEGDGTVPADRIEHAGELVAAMERYASEVRVQAYLGQIERRGGGPLDLDDDDVRGHIVATASQFLDLGFDGIHYDIEPIYPGDESFLDLLDRTHDLTQRHGAVLSVAVEQLEVVPGAQRVISVFLRDYHDPTKEYLRQVAARSDQVAIMTYDTGLPAAWLFGAYMARETERVIDAIGGDVVVFMGVPTYEDGSSLRFHPRSENMRSGIRGVRKGLDGLGRERTENVGVAIFAEWTTSDDEWAAYAADWLRN